MTLRTKLLALLALLAAGPLLAIGVVGYFLSLGAVAAQLESQTRPIAERAAHEIGRGVALVESDLGLLARNAETRRLLEVASSGTVADSVRLGAVARADSFFTAAWALFAPTYGSVDLRDGRGAVLISLPGARASAEARPGYLDGSGLVEYRVVAPAGAGRPPGSVRAQVRLASLLESDIFDARFGRRGVSAIVHRPSGRILHFVDESGNMVGTLGDVGLAELAGRLEEPGAVRIGRGGSQRIGWAMPVASLPWTVVALSELEEFQAPFRRQRLALSAVVLVLAAAVIPAGAVLLRRVTHSLEELTAAADRVGRGDFEPVLPPAGSDEVGRLSGAFQAMLGEVRRMMAEIARSQQLAAVGAFATELSHEIRNPLTAIKLNLQRLERMVAAGEIPQTGARSIALALGEIGRLDRVVRSALRLGRIDTSLELRRLELARVVERAVALVRPQLASADIALRVEDDDVSVDADEEALAGALVNLLLNAVESMPRGGELAVRTVASHEAGGAWADVHVADTGKGMPEALQANLFRPFFTTRKEGTGLGLPLALRAVEAHGGSITLQRSSAEGTELRLRLPLATPVRT